jgi:hypothetical protein
MDECYRDGRARSRRGSGSIRNAGRGCGKSAVGAWQRGDLTRCAALAERGIEAAKDDPVTGRLAREAIGDVCGFSGEFEAAADHFLAAVDLARVVGATLKPRGTRAVQPWCSPTAGISNGPANWPRR